MKKIYFFSLFCFVISSITAQLNDIESVEYDAINNRFLVSNSNSIIAINSDETMTTFGTTAAASFGMEIIGNTLFVIQNNAIDAYDLTTEAFISSLPISGAGFLNGMASDGVNRLWLTDFSQKKIHEINVSDVNNPSSIVVVDNTVQTPNGIVYDAENDRLVYVTWGNNARIKGVDLSDYSQTDLKLTTLANIDGIDNDNENNFYVVSWTPARLTKYNSDFSTEEIVSVPGGLNNPADISYAKEIDRLGIPNSGNNTVSFVDFEAPIDNLESIISELSDWSVFPNPITSNSVLKYTLKSKQDVSLRIFDTNGRLLKNVNYSTQFAGEYTLPLGDVVVEKGLYILELQVGEDFVRKQLVK